MQNIQPLHRTERRGYRQLFALLLLTPLAFGLAWADPMPTPSSAPAPTTGATDPNAKPIRPKDTPVVTKLPIIVVTSATRNTQPVETTATTTTVLTHQDLDDNKYASVPDALQSVPGLAVVTSGMPGGQTSVFIHGLDSNQTLITVDGRRQPVGISGADDNLANLTLDNIDQIEVVRTPTSSINGGSAMGGVINLVTLSGKGVATPEGSVSEEAGSFNTFKENAQSRGAVGNFDYAISATRQDSIYPALSTGTSGPFGSPGFAGQADQYRNTSYRGNFGYQITPDIYVDLHSAYSNAYTSVPNEFVFPDPTASLLIEDWSLSPEIVAKVTDFYTTKVYYTRDQQRQAASDPFALAEAPGFGETGQGDITRLQVNTDSVDWQNDFQIAHNWSVTAGVQGDNRHDYEYDLALGTRTFDEHDDNMGGFISSQWQPIEGLNILNSVRYDAYSQFGGAFSWREAASYVIAPTQTVVHASVARAFTPPPLQDRVVFFPDAFGPNFFPNPDLQPETSLGWEAGVEQPLWDQRVTPSITYFHNDIRNEIGNALLPTGDFMEENIGKATTDGFEVGLKAQPLSTVTLNANYTYLHAENDSTQLQLLRRPRNTIDFNGTWNPIAPLTLAVGGEWVMDRRDADAISGAEELAPDYFVLRASATYKINDHVSLWVRGENLTGTNYQPALGFYAPSIAAYGGIKVSF